MRPRKAKTTWRRAVALTTGAAIGPSAAGAAAAGDRARGDGMLRRADLNRGGAISAPEAGAMRMIGFPRRDVEGDSAVTEAEITAAVRARVARRFAGMDRNGDGRIDRTEFDEHGTAGFARMAADGDGRVTGEEMRARAHGWWHDRHGG